MTAPLPRRRVGAPTESHLAIVPQKAPKSGSHRAQRRAYVRSPTAKLIDDAIEKLPVTKRQLLEGKVVHLRLVHGRHRDGSGATHRKVTILKMHPNGTRFLAKLPTGETGEVFWTHILESDKRKLLRQEVSPE